jgi:hypothetical protein
LGGEAVQPKSKIGGVRARLCSEEGVNFELGKAWSGGCCEEGSDDGGGGLRESLKSEGTNGVWSGLKGWG